MYHVMAGVTTLLCIGGVILTVVLIEHAPAELSREIIAVALPAIILLVALFGAITVLLRQQGEMYERMRDISRTVDGLKK